MRRLFRTLAAILCVLLSLGNTNCTKNSSSNTPQFVTTLTLPSSTFTQGTTVQFLLSIRNRSDTAETLWFNTGEQDNIAVVNSGTDNTVWTSDGCSAQTSGFTSIPLAAGASTTVTVSWNLQDNSGNPLPTGDYEALGGFTVYNLTGQGGAADNGNSMPTCTPTDAQMFPTVYRSTLVPFTIQ